MIQVKYKMSSWFYRRIITESMKTKRPHKCGLFEKQLFNVLVILVKKHCPQLDFLHHPHLNR